MQTIGPCRARSRAEFIAKLGIVLEEADETVFWLELLLEGGIVKGEKLDALLKEARNSHRFSWRRSVPPKAS
ncbi:MAG: four helix bundle protein [Candidatus Sulfotelmatobacter sp.]